ncbi:HEPN domain-containing protein [Chryseosolibacter indicus]|uniref:Apea-like HEPN domain-containing protein n=1 Tax=Chryseosolibacter indicus TaxID=2782351 RepID=A0ABS5VY63_9BACT|nr:HEPN domain-containing protein [Chryseosolibacter indicus]MBT1706347.1 hypothetical protein [Chryseosolibacter indicus]
MMTLDQTDSKLFENATFMGVALYDKYLKSHSLQNARYGSLYDQFGPYLSAVELAESQIKLTKEFKELIMHIESHQLIKPLLGKSIGTEAGMAMLKSESFVIKSIRHYYENTIEVSSRTFQEHFIQVDKYLFDDTVPLSCWVLILNFEYEDSKIDFSETLRIRELSELELLKGRLKRDGVDNLNYSFAKENHSRFIVEKAIPFKKEVSTVSRVFSGSPRVDWKSISLEFRRVLNSLRILDHSDVRYNGIRHSEFKTFYPGGGSQSIHEAVPSIKSLEFLDLKKAHTKKLLHYHDLLVKKENDFKVPVNRLTYSIDRKELEDRLIDNIIGLEAIYRSSGSMHLGLRCGMTLEPKDKQKAKEIYLFVDQMRDLRNKVVHGSSLQKEGKDLNLENIQKLTGLLRASIQLKLEDESLFPSESKEWNELYFK